MLRCAAPYAAFAFLLGLLFLPLVQDPTGGLVQSGSDLPGYHLVQRRLQRPPLREGLHPTLWNPLAYGGTPVSSDPQSGFLYPPNWLHALWPTERGDSAYAWLTVAHLLVAGWGTVFWLRGRGIPPTSCLVGAVVFGLSGKWFHHVIAGGHVGFLVLAFAPWQLAWIDRIAERPGPRACACLAVVTAFAATGAHPQILFYTLLVVASYAGVAFAARGPSVRVALALAASALVAAAISAPWWAPVVADLGFYLRGAGVAYAEAMREPFEPYQWSWLFDPAYPGEVLGRWEQSRFVGVVGPALAPLALLRQRERGRVAFFLCASVFLVWYAAGEAGGLHRWLHDRVPGFALFRIPSRALVLLGLPLGFLAASGASAVQRRLPGRWGPVLAGGVAALAAADLARFDAPKVVVTHAAAELGDDPRARRIAGFVQDHERLGATGWAGLVLPFPHSAALGIENLGGFSPLAPGRTVRFLSRGASEETPVGGRWDQITPLGGLGLAAPAPEEGRRRLDLFHVRWVLSDLPLAVEGLVRRDEIPRGDRRRRGSGRRRPVHLYENVRALPHAMLVRRARLAEGFEDALARIARLDPRREVLVEDPGLAGSFPGSFRPVPVAKRADVLRMHVDAGAGGYLVVSEVWHPGWVATVDGKTVPPRRANALFQALPLGSGVHEVVLRFRPRSFRWSAAVSGVALLLSLAALVGGPRGPAGARGREARR